MREFGRACWRGEEADETGSRPKRRRPSVIGPLTLEELFGRGSLLGRPELSGFLGETTAETLQFLGDGAPG